MMNYGVNSEYCRLAAVILYKPGPEIGNHPDPAAIQHLGVIDHPALVREYDNIVGTFETLGIKATMIDPAPIGTDRCYRYNMMYCRDLLFMTPDGAILANMANTVRKEEPLYAALTLKSLGIPILHTVTGAGRFEGADALWLNEHFVAVGVGSRTNFQGYQQVAAVLKDHGVESAAVPSRQTQTQHLLGTVQIVDRDLALVRHEITDQAVIRLLREYGYSVGEIPENKEVLTRQAMNIVTIAPRTIVMTDGCPETRALYEHLGLTIAAELDLSQLMRGAGGLACATGCLARYYEQER